MGQARLPFTVYVHIPFTDSKRPSGWHSGLGYLASMGIRGLAAWLEEHAAAVNNVQTLTRGGLLLIDGCGFAYHLLHLLPATARLSDYTALHDATILAVAALRACGLSLRVYIDGRATRLKRRTLEHRRLQRADCWEGLMAACLDGRQIAASEYPEPMLLQQQVEASLVEASVPIVHCEGEADAELARDCAGCSSWAWVLGDDTDFLIYAGVRCIRFCDLVAQPMGDFVSVPACSAPWPLLGCSAGSISRLDLAASARVWDRALLMQLSELPDEQAVVEWALLGGNDHTSGLDWGILGEPFGEDAHELSEDDGAFSSAAARLELIRKCMMHRQDLSHEPGEGEDHQDGGERRLPALPPAHSPSSRRPTLIERLPVSAVELSEAVRFSQALYEHADTSMFPLDRAHEEASVEVVIPAGCAESVGEVALAELARGGGLIHVHRSDGSNQPALGTRHGEARCDPVHLRALRRLLDGERCNAATMGDVGTTRNLLPRLAWADVLVGRRFEAACRELLKSGLFPRVAPKDIFDGLSFHRLCALERQTAHEAAAQPPTLLPPAQLLPRSSEKHLQVDANVREHRRRIAPCTASPIGPSPDPSSLPLPSASLLLLFNTRRTSLSDGSPRRRSPPPVAAAASSSPLASLEVVSPSRAVALPRLASPRLQPLQAIAHRKPKAMGTQASCSGIPPADASPSASLSGRREGFGPCVHCGRSRHGEYDDDDAATPLYCLVCWKAYDADWTAPASPSAPATALSAAASPPGQSSALPVDQFEADVIRSSANHRVAIITGETGCGKSSRVPMMLLQASGGGLGTGLIFVAQPRRIAAYSLYTRAVSMGYGDIVGLRMGQDTRVEGPKTRLFYVTTGYLARMASHHPEAFERVSHLILDECHERSIEADVLCVMARQLLRRFRTLRVVLMSATVHTEMYVKYFAAQLHASAVSRPLHVGGARFPITVQYLDAVQEMVALPDRLRKAAGKLATKIDGLSALPAAEIRTSHSSAIAGLQLELAVWVVRLAAAAPRADGGCVGAVLIFVAGLSDIEELAESFNGLPAYRFVPIHSDFAFEEQIEAFAPAPPGITKIIAATNAAESSVTLPDVDVIVDLGVAKTVSYDATRNASVLSRTWLAKASATQRAGRTGRVRAGTVYRLYTQNLFEALPAHDVSGICDQPLEATVLQLRGMLTNDQSVSSLLDEAIEPPELAAVGGALIRLAALGFLHLPPGDNQAAAAAAYNELQAALATIPRSNGREDAARAVREEEDDDATSRGDGARAALRSSLFCTLGGHLAALDCAGLSATGRLAASLPVDYRLSRLVALGVQLECAAESIVLAAAIAMPKPVFRAASPLVQPSLAEYNELVRVVAEGRKAFDGEVHSEPLSYLSLYAALMRSESGRLANDSVEAEGGGLEDVGGVGEDDTAAAAVGAHASARDATDGLAAAQSEALPRRKATVRINANWCAQHGLAPRQVRMLCSTVSSLIHVVARQLSIPIDQLRLNPDVHLPGGREGSFRTARLRVLLVWTFPHILICAHVPKRVLRQAVGGSDGGDGEGPDDAVQAADGGGGTSVHLGTVVPKATLEALLPRPLRWVSLMRCCDVIQAAHARLPGPSLDALDNVIEGMLVPWLAPQFVFIMFPGQGSSEELIAWVHVECADEARTRIAPLLQLTTETIDFQVAVARTIPTHASGVGGEAGDPLAYGYATAGETNGTSVPAAAPSARYMRLVASLASDRGQKKAFEHYRSRRGLARDHRVVSVRVMANGTASVMAANCEPLTAPVGATLPRRNGRGGGGASAAQKSSLALSPDAAAVLAALLGPTAQFRVKPGQAEERQTIRFEADELPDEDGDYGDRLPSIIRDRPWGVRLLCLMASGHRDRLLRIDTSDPTNQPGGLAIKTSARLGLEWTLVAAEAKALLPRFSLLRVSIPEVEEDLRVWAVGACVLDLGGHSGRGTLVSVDHATLLPPGDEWLAAVLRCSPTNVNMPTEITRSILPAAQRMSADSVRAALDFTVLRAQPAAAAALRSLLDPWLPGDGGERLGGNETIDCPICFAHYHTLTGQVPRMECSTCHNHFHAACLFRWFRLRAAERRGDALAALENLCPLCQQPM